MLERIVVGTLQTNCYIYSYDQRTCIIIDPGGDPNLIAARLEAFGMVPRQIVLTHGHFDHTAGIAGLLERCREEWGERPEILIHAADRTYLGPTGMRRNLRDLEYLGFEAEQDIAAALEGLPRADGLLEEGQFIAETQLRVIETPGHSPGSICLYSEERGVLFSGDTLFAQGVGRCDLPRGSESKLRKSITEKLLTLPPETRVYPGHGPFTSIERELLSNPFLTPKDS